MARVAPEKLDILTSLPITSIQELQQEATTEMDKWNLTTDKLPNDLSEHVLCLIEVGCGPGLPTSQTPPNPEDLQFSISSMDEHPGPFTGDYPEDNRYNWRVWYWRKLPPIPNRIDSRDQSS